MGRVRTEQEFVTAPMTGLGPAWLGATWPATTNFEQANRFWEEDAWIDETETLTPDASSPDSPFPREIKSIPPSLTRSREAEGEYRDAVDAVVSDEFDPAISKLT